MMKWQQATGLMEGLYPRLRRSEARLLLQQFNKFSVDWKGYDIVAAGIEIWKSLCLEDHIPPDLRNRYHGALIDLMRTAKKETSPNPVTCCKYHIDLYDAMSTGLRSNDGIWLTTFFDVLTAITKDLHLQSPSSIDLQSKRYKRLSLSRFMLAHNFIDNHIDETPSDDLIKLFRQRLSPSLTRAIRKRNRDSGVLGFWHGRIGSYPGISGYPVAYTTWCEGIKSFATLTKNVDLLDRADSPSRLLQCLGIPFRAGEFWIELQYRAQDVSHHHPHDNSLKLHVPTPIEAAGNWAFVPDRDPKELTNHARDLRDGKRGLPEIVHALIDTRSLVDAIVWEQATERDWPDPSSPFVT